MKKVNLGLIGLGTMGRVHLINCLRLKNAKLVSVSDSSKKALQFAKKAGVKNVQSDYNKLLNSHNPSIDAVIVSLPNFLHYECAKKAAEKGKDIFLEKPLARNVKEGKQILSHVKSGGVKLMIGYPLRFTESFAKLKGKLKSGLLGDVQVASATNISAGPFSPRTETSGPTPVPAWWFNKELTGGGPLLDLGSHMINLLRWYFGDITHAESYLGHRFNMDFEDHAVCLLKFKDGPIATVNVGWFSKDYRVSVELYGTAKHVSEVRSAPSLLDFAVDVIGRKFGRIERSAAPYYKELQHFVECVNSNTAPCPSGEEGLADLETIEMAYKNIIRLDL